ncbi:MAG TPA: hypothetical protein VK957_00145 [Lunatimonas sp.]|nr:hypothetical protein [Lunatimonas sp.]
MAVDKISEVFLLLNSKGGILGEVLRRGEGPNEINTNLLAVSFNQEEGGYFSQSSLEQLRFNDAWEVKERIKSASYAIIRFYSGPRMSVPYYYKPGDSVPYFFTSFFSGVNSNSGSEVELEIADHLIEQYNPNKKDLEWVLPFAARQVHRRR